MEQTDDPVELVERVAALDLGKADLVACVRVPHEDRPGRRRQEIRKYTTLSRSLLELADWLPGRQMLGALIAGQRDPKVLAAMARGTMRSKIAVLEEALTGHFEDHHGFLVQVMLQRIDALTAQIEAVGARIQAVIALSPTTWSGLMRSPVSQQARCRS
jgi:transposase